MHTLPTCFSTLYILLRHRVTKMDKIIASGESLRKKYTIYIRVWIISKTHAGQSAAYDKISIILVDSNLLHYSYAIDIML